MAALGFQQPAAQAVDRADARTSARPLLNPQANADAVETLPELPGRLPAKGAEGQFTGLDPAGEQEVDRPELDSMSLARPRDRRSPASDPPRAR